MLNSIMLSCWVILKFQLYCQPVFPGFKKTVTECILTFKQRKLPYAKVDRKSEKQSLPCTQIDSFTIYTDNKQSNCTATNNQMWKLAHKALREYINNTFGKSILLMHFKSWKILSLSLLHHQDKYIMSAFWLLIRIIKINLSNNLKWPSFFLWHSVD